MEKFSFYELLSFLIPGFIVVKITEYYAHCFEIQSPVFSENDFFNGVLVIILSLIIGLMIHTLTFKLMKYKWYKKYVYQPEKCHIISKSGSDLFSIIPAINKLIVKDMDDPGVAAKIESKADNNSTPVQNEYYPLTFDFAYYYLEVNGKLTQSMRFQSLYFLFRNLFTISLLHLIVFGCIWLISIWWHIDFLPEWYYMLTLIGALLLLTYLITNIATFMRGKMIDRVLWSYYVARKFQKGNNNK